MANNEHKDEVPVRPYEADGIKELDNNLPSWWIGLFVFTTIFGALYMVYVHLIGGTSIQKEYDDSLKVTYAAPAKSAEGSTDEPTDLASMIGNSTAIGHGKEAYTANCAPCHGADGQGNIGPNLADKFWIHGGKSDQIYNTVFNGFAEKGMPAWGGILGEQKVRQITAFIVSIKGTTPPNPKAPQGNEEP